MTRLGKSLLAAGQATGLQPSDEETMPQVPRGPNHQESSFKSIAATFVVKYVGSAMILFMQNLFI